MSNTKPLDGLKVVLTGEFNICGRDEATRQLESLGADVTGSVSKKTQMVIAGTKPGESKLSAAKKNGIPILDESALKTLLVGKMISAEPVSVSATAVAPSAAVPKSSEPESSAPDDLTGGLTRAQLTRFRKLLESDEYGAWEYFHEKRTNTHLEDQPAAARVNLWLARSGYEFCLGEIVWAKHYSVDENLEVLKGHSLPTEERGEEIFAYWHWYADLAKQRPEQLKALVRSTLSWSEHRTIGFKLLLWLTDTAEALDLSIREQRVLASKLAKMQVWNPKIAVSRFVPVRPNVPLTPRDFALTVLPKHVWVDALMQLEDDAGTFGKPGFEEHGRFSRVVDIFLGMKLSDVERFISDYDAQAFPDDLSAMASFFRAKDLSVSELIRVASSIVTKRVASQHIVPSRLVDVLCLNAAEKDIEAPVDGLITFAIRHQPWIDRYRSWLSAIGPSRRSAVEERVRRSEPSACFPPEFEDHSGWDPDALNDTRARGVLSRLQDPRFSDAGAFGREATMALFTLPPTSPVVRHIIERMLSLKVWMYSLFEYVLPFHPNPSLLLEVIADVHQHTKDRTADRTEDLKQLRTFIQNTKIQVTAKFTGDWAEHFGEDGQAAASDAEAASGRKSERVSKIEALKKLASGFDGTKTPIYAMEIGTELGTLAADGPFAKGPFLGENPRADTDTVILTIPFVTVPELAHRYPEHDHLSILLPSKGGWDFEAGYVVSYVATKKRAGRACPVTLHRIEVPSDVFVTALRQDEEGEPIEGPLQDLYKALWSLDGYLLGEGLYGQFNNTYHDVESEGPNPKFIACLHHQEEKLFVYSDQVMWIR